MNPPASPHQRVYILDLLRFIAAFGVMLYHYTWRLPTVDHLGGPQFPELDVWTRYLHLGVQLFFIISGFVIAFSAEGKTAGQFTWSRFVRLYPAYWLCVCVTFAVCHYLWRPHFELGLREGLINLTMFQAYFKVPHVEWAYWTLAEELRFYILVGLLLALKQWHRMLAFVAVWMVLCFIDIFKHVPLAHYEMALDQAPFFAAGMVYYDAFKRGFRPVHWLLIAVTAALGCKRFLDWSYHDAIERHAVCSPVVVVCILLSMHLVFIGIASHKLVINKSYRLLAMAGGMTYPLYLIHNRVGFSTIIALEPILGRWQALVLTCLGALVLAYGIWRFWELPFAVLLKRLKARSTGHAQLTKPVAM